MKIVIPGQPIVKKNTQIPVRLGSGRMIRVPTKAYKQWHKGAAIALEITNKSMKPLQPISEPINLCCRFFMQTRRKTDLSNLYEGIQDVLVSEGWLEDDHSGIVCSHDGSGVFYDKMNPRIEVTITPK